MADETTPTPDMTNEVTGADLGADLGAAKSAEFESLDLPDAVVDAEVPPADDAVEETFSAPEEYVEREKGGRSRRVGSEVRIEDIDYKNVALLSRFLDRRGRILSRRKTRVSAKMQRRIEREIKRARHLALVPYTADQTRVVKRRR